MSRVHFSIYDINAYISRLSDAHEEMKEYFHTEESRANLILQNLQIALHKCERSISELKQQQSDARLTQTKNEKTISAIEKQIHALANSLSLIRKDDESAAAKEAAIQASIREKEDQIYLIRIDNNGLDAIMAEIGKDIAKLSNYHERLAVRIEHFSSAIRMYELAFERIEKVNEDIQANANNALEKASLLIEQVNAISTFLPNTYHTLLSDELQCEERTFYNLKFTFSTAYYDLLKQIDSLERKSSRVLRLLTDDTFTTLLMSVKGTKRKMKEQAERFNDLSQMMNQAQMLVDQYMSFAK